MDERLSRLDELAKKVAQSLALGLPNPAEEEHRAFVAAWPAMKDALAVRIAARDAVAEPEAVQAVVATLPGKAYLREIQSLPPEAAQALTAWLAACPAAVAALQG